MKWSRALPAGLLPAALIIAALFPAGPAPAGAAAARPATEANRRIITAFARMLYVDRQVERAFSTYVVPDYIQHNPGLPDGRDGAVKALQPMFARPGSQFEIKRIVVDGDVAMIHLFGRGDPATRGAAVVDIYRLSGGRIVEHWDVIQPLPTTSANPHPMF